MKMNRDAIRVVGSEAVNKCMNVPINLKSRDQYGELIWNAVLYADYRVGWLLHPSDVSRMLSDKRINGCFEGVRASGLVKRNKMDEEIFANLITSLGPTKRNVENFGEWFYDVVKGEMIEVNDISRCYILGPLSMAIWEIMQV
jgi:hypothetical protein